MSIYLFFSTIAIRRGYRLYISWNYTLNPHMLITGSTGCGKTYAVKLLLARISLHIPDALITVCDYKADDFKFLRGSNNYYEFNNCLQGLDDFYNRFQLRQSEQDSSRTFCALVFDEFASFLNSLDKKVAEEAKRKMASLLMLGRSFNIHVIVSMQRADANYFASARDNFSIIIALGALSKEAKEMLFKDFKEQMQETNQQGKGYLSDNSGELKLVTVPYIRKPKKLEGYIKQAVDRY